MMELCRAVMSLAVLFVVIHEGSGQTDQTDKRLIHRERQRQRLAELARASTSFGISLYQQLASRDNNNVIFSPFSVFTALSMTLLGTEGATKEQLRNVMAQRPRQGVHRALRAIFNSFPTSPIANVTLRVANALFYDNARVTLKNTFNHTVRRFYGASPRGFERPNPERAINEWVKQSTGDKIQDFLSDGAITSDVVLLLLNAVYFQGTWRNIFDERFTREGTFTTASGAIVPVPMMSRDGRYSIKVVDEIRARVLELPFGTDNRFSMFILLPHQINGLANVEARLNPQILEDIVGSMPPPERYDIQIPKFTLRVKTSMKTILQAMGLTHIFSDSANLARMSPRPLKVADVKHEAVIEVDEKGAVAAAVTSVEIVFLSLPQRFRVDHPFLLIVRDKKARLNLFMGRVNDPSQQA